MGLLEDFFSGLRKNTVRAYRRDLEAFREFLGAPTAADAIKSLMTGGYSHTMERFALYMEHLLRLKMARSTIARYIATVRSTLLLAERKDLITWTPPPRPPFPPAYKDTASGDHRDLDLALEELSMMTSPIAIRDRGIVLLIGRMALRRGEVAALNIDEVSLKQNEISLRRADGRATDTLQLTPEVSNALERWLSVRGSWPGPFFAAVRIGHVKQKRISNRAIGRIVARYRLESPRLLRHMAITSYLEKSGGDLAGARELGRIRRASTVGTYERNRQEAGDRL